MEISTVREQLAAALRAGVASDPPLIALAHVPDSVNAFPTAYLQPTDGDFGRTYASAVSDGAAEARFTLVLLVSRTDDVASQKRLDGLIPLCRAAMQDDGAVAGCEVLVPSWSDYGWHKSADGNTALGVRLAVVVNGPGDW
jgi:hypothetical protein